MSSLTRVVMTGFRSVVGLVLVSLVWIGCGPSASKEGQGWSHTELITFLKGKGVALEAKKTDRGTFFGRAMVFQIGDERVCAQVRKTAQDARDAASAEG